MKSLNRWGSVAAAALAALSLAACGSSDGGDSAQAETANVDIGKDVEAVVDTPKTMKEGVLTVCASFGNPPNAYYTTDHVETGSETDIARVLGPLMGLKTEFHETKFASLIPTLQATQCDVIMSSLYIKPEREEIVDFVPYMQSGQAVVVSQDNPKEIAGFDDSLCGTKIGYQVSTTAEEYVKKQKETCSEGGKGAIDTVKVEDGTMGMQQVQTGQIDAFVDTQSAAVYTVGKTNGQMQVVGKPFGLIDIGAAVKKDNSQLQDALSDAFDELVKSGQYEEILKQYDSADMALEEEE
ncbi:ABC transporter substrate-binding protein [Brevibacterium renqingii]|uniref:ABC transporter substrate-binding protein n=1 Tax=Brevibacterium renqingii TaxID=2776916 RepID=UPI001ADFC8F7|nr:ABC transporter substrate-binding protein [Brevibacterium renqingii]